MLLGATAVVVLAAGYGIFRSLSPRIDRGIDASADSARSIAILPFTNVGGDPTNEPFSDGIADELTTALGKVDGLLVAARASAFGLKRKGLDPREIGRQLRVHYIVEGRVKVSKDRRRVAVDLIDVASGKEVWSDNFDYNALNRDEFTVQDSMTRSIVRRLLPHIAPTAIAAAAKHATESPEAHEFYRQGRYYFEKRDSASLSMAQRYFERAVSKDTMYALAYDGLSDAYSHQSVWGYTLPRVSFPKAKVYAARALALDSTLAEVHSSLAFISLFYDWDLPAAGAEFRKAISLNPSYAPAHLFYAWYFTASDSMSAAIREGRRAVELDPSSSLNYLRVVSFLFYDRRYEEALGQAQRIFQNDPKFPGLSSELARAYAYLGRCDEALTNQHFEPSAIFGGVKGYILAKCGRRPQAFAELDRLRAQAVAGKYVPHYALAVILSGLGKKDEAIGELEKAFVVRDWPMFMLKRDPAWDLIRSDPRFVALVRKVGLAT
jgi:TolB-like protein